MLIWLAIAIFAIVYAAHQTSNYQNVGWAVSATLGIIFLLFFLLLLSAVLAEKYKK